MAEMSAQNRFPLKSSQQAELLQSFMTEFFFNFFICIKTLQEALQQNNSDVLHLLESTITSELCQRALSWLQPTAGQS